MLCYWDAQITDYKKITNTNQDATFSVHSVLVCYERTAKLSTINLVKSSECKSRYTVQSGTDRTVISIDLMIDWGSGNGIQQ
jgi:hypothetical protein